MGQLIVGSEALTSGQANRHQLRTRYTKVHHNVYSPVGVELTAFDRAHAAWLWSRRDAVLVGHSAAAALGSKWLPADAPAELARSRHAAVSGILVRRDMIADDEIVDRRGIPCTTAARTAYDIGRRTHMDESIIRVDALLNATRCDIADIEAVAARYPGARGVRQLRQTLDLVDAGAESPQETRLRLLLVREGLPRPTTQIPVTDDRGRVIRRIDLGWPQWLVGVEYDGEQHFTNAEDYANDIDRLEFLAARGWTIVRVSSRQLRHQRPLIVTRVTKAIDRAGAQYV